jgi:parallel beta-helix repeat protein
LYVDNGSPSCSDTGVGSQTQPFCTIGAAAAVVTAGETVQVASGTYPESVAIKKSGISGSPIVFRAAPGATVTLTGQTDGFTISGQAWVTVKGFTVTNTSSFGIYVSSSSHITISGNHVSHSGHPVSGQTATGIRLSGTTDSLVLGNTADHNTYAGIEVNSSSTRNEVRGNTTFANASMYTRRAPGIRVYQAPGNTIDRNISHENEDSGIECYPGANNSLIYSNVSYRNGDHGIDDNGCPGNRIFGNTVYKNVTAGINVEGSSTGGTIANNVSVDNGIKSPRTHGDIRIERGSTAGTTVDNDLVYLTTTDTLLIWDSVSYTTLAAFQAASGQEMHAIVADPRWVSTSASDFHLRAGSPAIDSADSGVSGWPDTDVEGLGRVDDPATANKGLGPRPYDDRGAYEYQPSGDLPPTASLTVSPVSGTAPLAVTADASASSDGDATPIASYRFDFGDGTIVGPQTAASAAHTFQTAGAYTVTVTVTDTAGLSSTATATATVQAGSSDVVGNPGFEADLTGWSKSGSDPNVALSRVAGGHTGSWAAEVSNTGSTNATSVLNDSPNWALKTGAGTYTGSIWARADTAGGTLKLRFREYSGSTLVGSATTEVTLSTSWQQVTVTYAVSSPGSTLDFNAYVAQASPGVVFYADDASITQS